MRDKLQAFLEVYQKYKTRRLKLVSLLLVASIVVFGNVFWQLHHTGITMTNETSCGIVEHRHTEACVSYAPLSQTEYTSGTDLYVISGSDIYLVSGTDLYSQSDDSVLSLSDVAISEYYYMVYTCGCEEHTHIGTCYSDPSAVETPEEWEATVPKKLSGIQTSDLVTVARSQLGYTESTANYVLNDDGTRNGYTRYGDWYGNKYGNWNAMFVSFCLNYAGVSNEYFPYSSGAYGWPYALIEADCWYDADSTSPFIGDVIFFDTDLDGDADRVGIVSSVSYIDNTLTVIEGDCDNAVKEVTYTADDSRIFGFGVVPLSPEYVTVCDDSSGRTLFDNDHIKNLTQTYSGQVVYDPINGTYAIINFRINFESLILEVAPEDYRYVYNLPKGLTITDEDLFGKTFTANTFEYEFIKNDDGTQSIYINFDKDKVQGTGIGGNLTFNCTADASFLNEDGELEIVLPGGTVTIPTDDITYPENETHKYNISTSKSSAYNSEDGTITYTVTVTSGKGTPTSILLTDVLSLGSGDYVLDFESISGLSVEKRYYATGSSDYTSSPVDGYTVAYNSDGTIKSIELPKIENADGYSTTYVITYTVNVGDVAAGGIYYVNNTAAVSSTDTTTGENVSSSAGDSFAITNEVIAKSGSYDSTNKQFQWSITFNGSGNDIAGAQLLDTKFADAENLTVYLNGSEVSAEDGNYTLISDSDGKLTAIEFNAVDGSTANTNTYVVKYTTPLSGEWDAETQTNTATYDPTPGDDDTSDQKSDSATATGESKHLSKKRTSYSINKDEYEIIIGWQTTVTVPANGISSGTKVFDILTTEKNSTNYHSFTYEQLKNISAEITDNSGKSTEFTGFTIEASDGWNWYSLSDIASNEYYQGLAFTKFKIVFNADVSADEAEKITFSYYSTADILKITAETTFKNIASANDDPDKTKNKDSSKLDYTPDVVKVDNAHNNSQTATEFESSEGKVSWGIYVNLPSDYTAGTPVTIVETLPTNSDLELLEIKAGHGSGDWQLKELTVADDGTISCLSDNDYWKSGFSGYYDKDKQTITVNFDGNNSDVINAGLIYMTISCKVLDNYVLSGSDYVYKTAATHVLDNKVEVSVNGSDYGSDNQQQTVTIPKTTITETKPDEGDDDDDKKPTAVGKKYLAAWKDSQQREDLAYSIDVNINATDFVSGSDVLYLSDTLKYKLNYWNNAPQKFELLHESVALYYAVVDTNGVPVLDSEGRLQKGVAVPVSLWAWKYYEESYTIAYDGDYAECIITATVPDGVALIFEYKYRQTTESPSTEANDYVNASNNAKLTYHGETFESYSYYTDKYWKKLSTSGEYSVIKGYSFIKVDSSDYNYVLYGTEFDLYKFNPTISTYEKVRTYPTDKDNPTLTIEWSDDFEYNTAYYIVESKAPDDYRLPDYPTPYYFYFSNDDTTTYPEYFPSGFESKAIDLSSTTKTEYVTNEYNLTDIVVNKKWLDVNGKDVTNKQNGSIAFKLYQVKSEYNPGLIELNFVFTDTSDNKLYKKTYYVNAGTVDFEIYMPKESEYYATEVNNVSIESTGERLSTGSSFVKYNESQSSKGYYIYTLNSKPFISENTTILGNLKTDGNSSEIIYVTKKPTNEFLEKNTDKIIVYVKSADSEADSGIDNETGEVKDVTFTIDAYHNYDNMDTYHGYFEGSYKYGSTITVTSYAALTSDQYWNGYYPFFRYADDESIASQIPTTESSTTSGGYTIATFTTDSIVLNGDNGVVAFTNYNLANHSEYDFEFVTEKPSTDTILANPGVTYFYIQVDESTAVSGGDSGDSGESGDDSNEPAELHLYFYTDRWAINRNDSMTINSSGTYTFDVDVSAFAGKTGSNTAQIELWKYSDSLTPNDVKVSAVFNVDGTEYSTGEQWTESKADKGGNVIFTSLDSYSDSEKVTWIAAFDDYTWTGNETVTVTVTVENLTYDSGSSGDSGETGSDLTVSVNKEGTVNSATLSGYNAGDTVNVTIFAPRSDYYGGGWLKCYAGVDSEYSTTLVNSTDDRIFENIVLDESLTLYCYIGDGGSELLVTDNAADATEDSGKYIVYVEKSGTSQYSLSTAMLSLTAENESGENDSAEGENDSSDSTPVIGNLSTDYTVSLYDEYTVTSEDGWSKVIPDLPLTGTDENGKRYYYSYYIEEVTVAGYDTTYSNISSDGVITSVVSDKTPITVTNKASGKYVLAETGGIGTIWFVLIAVMLFALAGFIYKFGVAAQPQATAEVGATSEIGSLPKSASIYVRWWLLRLFTRRKK